MSENLKSAEECFGVEGTMAEEVEELRETFSYKPDLRAALEGYFHIYDDFAEMSEEEFGEGFKKFSEGMD